ncbi:MAG: DUF3187 family protein [Deltaproteobacteria bacterium]|jgi:hypothetical protein
MKRSAAELLLLLIAALFFPCRLDLARAADFSTPFPSRHLNPLVQVFGLPAAEPAKLLPSGRVSTRLSFEGANNFSLDSSPSQQLTLDGETYRVTLALRLGLPKRFEVGIDLPYLAHNGGVFDGIIDDFHNVFGFYGSSRESVPRNQLTYRYVRNGKTLFDIEESVSGIGDLMLHGGVQLYRREEPAPRFVALQTSLKLPTGDASKLTGSGSTDFALELLASDAGWLRDWHLAFFGGIGALLMGDADLLPEQQRHVAGFGFFGFGWEPLRWLDVKLQLDGHTSFFKGSDFKRIDHWATQLVGGFTFHMPAKILFDLAISENVFVETAPDVSLLASLKRRF